jgi:HSP20 family protein
MLVRYDPFREFDRLTDQFFGSGTNRTHWMPMDAIRHEHQVELRFDLPGIAPESLDVEVERNVLTVRAERSWTPAEGDEVLAQERPQGSVSRQVMLGESLETESLEATYDAGVLTIRIPVAEQAKARKVEIQQGSQQAIDVGSHN